jgi:hypothetical protein
MRWEKCHGGTNVMVGQMSWWDKCHGGTNVMVAQMSCPSIGVINVTFLLYVGQMSTLLKVAQMSRPSELPCLVLISLDFLLTVLSTLQQIDVNKYKLKNEIVFAQPSQIEQSKQVNFYDLKIQEILGDFDDSQRQAFFHALKDRLAIIQGPPGKLLPLPFNKKICW